MCETTVPTNSTELLLFGASRQSIVLHLQNYGPTSEKLKYGDIGAIIIINNNRKSINIYAATVKTIYTTSTVKYRSNTDFNFRY